MTAEARRAVIERAATSVFAERGYHNASMDEIAKRAQITVPVLYDHFESKQELHLRLLELHFLEMRTSWRGHLLGSGPLDQRVFKAMDAWFAYVQDNPHAWRMLFQDSGEDEADAVRRNAAAESWSEVLRLLPQELGAKKPGRGGETGEMLSEVLRSGMQGLALWWQSHSHVPRQQVVTAAMNVLWMGFEQIQRGEIWRPPH